MFNEPYLQDIVDIHHFLQNLPVPVRNKATFSFLIKSQSTHLTVVNLNVQQTVQPGDFLAQAISEVFIEEKPVERLLHRVGRLQCIPGDGDGDACHHSRLCALTGQIVQQYHSAAEKKGRKIIRIRSMRCTELVANHSPSKRYTSTQNRSLRVQAFHMLHNLLQI